MRREFSIPIALFMLSLAVGTSIFAQQGYIRVGPPPRWPANGDVSQLPPDQYIFFDSPPGEIVVAYPEDMSNPQFSRRIILRFGSPAEVQPVVLPQVERLGNGTYLYTYTVQNFALGRIPARIPIAKWRIAVAASDDRFQASHPGWDVAYVGSVPRSDFPARLDSNGMSGPRAARRD